MRHVFRRSAAFVVAALVLALTATVASADGPGWKTVAQFPGPAFGLNAGQGDTLLVGGPEGPVKLDPDDGDTELIASIPFADVIQTGRREYYLVTGEGERGPDDGPCPAMALCRVKNGDVKLIADIFEWELDNDPDGSGNVPDEDSISNPFDLSKLGNKFLVADAGGNSILKISKNGNIQLIAVLPYEDLETQSLKDSVGCPTPPSPDLQFICELPASMTADPVATTATIGPDGAIYAGELKGFPAIPGTSRVWRIERDARGVHCGTDADDCTQVNAPPFTSIIEMEAHGKTIYVLEVDEASWLAAEGGGTPGGTVNACRASGGGRGNGNGDGDNDRRRSDDDDDDDDNGNGKTVTWTCEEVVTGLPFPTAITKQDGSIFVTLINAFQGPFEVVELTNGNGNGNGGDDDDD